MMPKIVQLYRSAAGGDCALADDGTTWWWRASEGGRVGEWREWTGGLPQSSGIEPGPRLAKMAEALKQLAELGEIGMRPDYSEWVTFHDKVARIARSALAEYEAAMKESADAQ